MTSAEILQSWLLEGLAASGGSASPVDIAKQVWARHRGDLESAGDLFYTWQIDLRASAETLRASGVLHIDDAGAWVMTDAAADMTATKHPTRWDAEEIAVAVEAYVSMMRDSADGRPLRRAEAAAHVRDTTGRSSAAVDAMFANISAVVQELGLDYLSAYPPRSNIPPGVRQAVGAHLGR